MILFLKVIIPSKSLAGPHLYITHTIYVCYASLDTKHYEVAVASLGKGYRDFPLHMGTENISDRTGTRGNTVVHTLAFTLALISTLDQSKVLYIVRCV